MAPLVPYHAPATHASPPEPTRMGRCVTHFLVRSRHASTMGEIHPTIRPLAITVGAGKSVVAKIATRETQCHIPSIPLYKAETGRSTTC